MLKNKADLSQQFASFCSLLKLSSYKQHKWYLYPPIMPQVLGRSIAISHSLNIYYAESAICSTCSHTSNDRNVSVCYQTLTLRGGLGTRLYSSSSESSSGPAAKKKCQAGEKFKVSWKLLVGITASSKGAECPLQVVHERF